MRKLSRIIALGVLGLVVASCVPVSLLSHTCVVCRLGRTDATCFGLTYSSYDPNECSRWYSDHVEPTHAHLWERGTCQSKINLIGVPLSVGCRPGHYPIRLLPPSTQMRVYQHFGGPLQAKALFESLTDEKTHNDRLDEDDEDRGHLMVRAIVDWDAQGYPGSWDAWWAGFHARHVQEHQEWLSWMDADSDLNFQDWQKQQKNRKKGD